ncbi:MAG: helix-turn-helix domain-containing protein, partial [Oligoflexia bacterium]|nr:helix-turn-helix domain-containing protein [Oligoflexia bacterium]
MVNNTTDFIIDTHKEILNIENAADILGISTATVRNWIKSGQLPT